MILADTVANILKPHLSHGGPGIVVSVAHRDELLFHEAFGLAHIELGVPMAADMVFPIASITKHMVATCALLVAADGLIDIEAPLGSYLTELSPLQGAPSLRQLMTHQSGLHCHLDVGPMTAEMYAIRQNDFCLDLMRSLTTVNAAPGAWQTYGNAPWSLLSTVIERVCGKPFEEVMAERLFQPMGLRTARFFRGADKLRTGVTSLYVPGTMVGSSDDGWVNTSDLRTENLGEGGVHCNAADLLKWAGALRREDTRIPAALWRELKTPAVLADGTASDYGLGLMMATNRGIRTMGHGGGLIGLTSFMMTFPDHALEVVILANSMVPTEQLAFQIGAAVIGESALGPAPKPAKLEDFQGLEGAVFESPDSLVRVGDVGGGVGLSWQGLPFMPVNVDESVESGVMIQSPLGPVRLAFPEGPGGDHALFKVGGETQRCARQAAPDPAAPNTDIVGEYVRDDLGSRIRVSLADGELTATRPGRYGLPPVTLTALAADAFLFNSTGLAGAYLCRLIRDESGAVTGLRFDTTRTRDFRFRRVPDVAA
jgi:CubicO group peptidase (beta-lactamase class C family)